MKKLIWCFTAILMISGSAIASPASSGIFNVQYLKDKTVFPGDNHGDFARDYVAVLTDYSEWKVHPKDSNTFYAWNFNDPVYIQVRTDSYCCKREHKFKMINLANNQSVRVMLTKYPYFPLIIVYSEVYWVDTVVHTTEHKDDDVVYYDEQGNVLYIQEGETHYTHTYEKIYEKLLVLNDGSRWAITNQRKFDSYMNGNYVYLLLQDGKYRMISGIQREATLTTSYEVLR